MFGEYVHRFGLEVLKGLPYGDAQSSQDVKSIYIVVVNYSATIAIPPDSEIIPE
jgi:hypothetical protein